ncbi:MAG: hypothetical protein HWE10_00935 [Gammaproteobacteria bacterium]|nr:hypothetical protein [Gammaproteobacteria bacterium]
MTTLGHVNYSMHLSKVVIVVLLSLFSSTTYAEQLLFNKTLKEDKYLFEYVWLDRFDNEQTLSFELPLTTVNDTYRHFKALRPSLLRAHSLKKLKQAAAQINPREGRVTIKPTLNGVEFGFVGYDQEWMNNKSQEFSKLYEQSLQEYLRQEYYIEFNSSEYLGANKSTKVYKPDHKRFAMESAELLTPIVDAIKQKMPNTTVRNIARFILSWLQTIPYDTIESRAETNGAGFLPPARVIANNIGDCDSKVTLMAAIVKALFPRLNIAIIYVPQHALIAFHMSHLENDYKIDIEGLSYTLAEPVGPALLDFSEVSERSKRFIESGFYSVELL